MFLFSFACVVHVFTCSHVYSCARREEAIIWSFLHCFSTTSLTWRSSFQPDGLLAGQCALGTDMSLPSLSTLRICTTMSCIDVGAGYLNLGPHVCAANTIPIPHSRFLTPTKTWPNQQSLGIQVLRFNNKIYVMTIISISMKHFLT